MNRFRTKKRAKDDTAAPRPSVESESSGPFRMFGKKKVQEEEPKHNIDLATALPSSDDFRTSLLMNGLSARFSMLREQDDPNSKIGKASDDSVLFPKRQSRLDLFGSGLHDIAEVESIRAPPFSRMDSMQSSDDAASTSGSVMSRAKPTEGNNLFGGRQKIYKITPGNNAKAGGGLPGRALYDDDVAQSAFQRWRQAEKERASLEEQRNSAEDDRDPPRSASPAPVDFQRRRETNSTTSSGPSLARNSTAATSITSSHPGAAEKDRQVGGSIMSGSASTNNIPERSVTRTRRLYEQGLTQELQDSQTSALSRFDTISKQRPFGMRSPDLNQQSASPTASTFGDRRPTILSKASAPNLRSFSPNANSQMNPAEFSPNFPPNELKSNIMSSPPLSPPVSETEEHPMLAIQPNDRGKATAMGVFSRPAQQYDESKYAQRQRQLQQGRETPTSRFRTESNASVPTSRSRSSSSMQRLPSDRMEAPLKQPTVKEEPTRTTFFDDSDGESSPPLVSRKSKTNILTPRVALERPNDQDHPALRQSALPTPLSITSKMSDDPSPIFEKPEASSSTSRNMSPEDSPTLGPQSGLSGMVRQHLRNDSNASSVYGTGIDGLDSGSRLSDYPGAGRALDSMVTTSNPWMHGDQDRSSFYGTETTTPSHAPTQAPPPVPTSVPSVDVAAPQSPGDKDDFARHLADGARRVRERLTSYVETDNSQSAGTYLTEPQADLQPPQRPSTRGSLKSKSSFGSIRNKEPRDPSQSRAKKMLGIGASTMNSAPSPTKPTNAEAEIPKEETQGSSDVTANEPRSSSEKEDKEENVHAGLKAFRQARRELQRMKELETRQRRGGPGQQGQPGSGSSASPQPASSSWDRAPTHRTPSQETQDRSQPPVSYRNRMPSDDMRSGSRAASRASERDRSGSEASEGRSHSRPPYLHNIAVPHEENYQSMSPSLGPSSAGMPRHSPMNRSPGFMAPGGPHGNQWQHRAQDLPERSPGLPASPRPGATTPMGGAFPKRPAPQGANSDSLLDGMGSQGFAPNGDPYLNAKVRNGAPLPTTASTPNLHGAATAPPLPPINPRRKNTSGGFRRQMDGEESTASSPQLAFSPSKMNGRMTPQYDDSGYVGYGEPGSRKTSMDQGPSMRARVHNSPPRNGRIPPPVATMQSGNMPGGMF